MAFFDDLAEELRRLEAQGRRRRMRPVVGPQAAVINIDGRQALNFSSNNYLGLAASPDIAAAAADALARFGPGSGASRLIAGTLEPHRQLEQLLARTYDFPAALIFNSGYQANVGIVSALAGPEDVVFSDALNHASLIDGCRMARARVEVYPHGDLGELDRRFSRVAGRRRLLVSDTIFSMDGDLADVQGLRALADRHGAALILDEAHAFGVLGPRGAGVAASVGVVADANMATFSKALGGFGAFVAGPATLTEYLLNRARSFVFTTALPPSIAAAAAAAVALVASEAGDLLRTQLSARVEQFRAGLAALGLLTSGAGRSPIFPVQVGDDRRVMELSDRLLARGIYAQGIRPPTVPPGTARLRFSLMATHTAAQVETALGELALAQREGLLPPAR